jgi:predicted phosphodiesterase
MLWLRKLLFKPVLWLSNRFASAPDKGRVFRELSDLLDCIVKGQTKKGLLLSFHPETDRFLIFSDQHKGAKNGADDFMICEPNYLAALDYYYQQQFFFISLGDCEELWENTLNAVKKHQKPAFASENRFVVANRFLKIFGNHDLYWENSPLAPFELKQIYTGDVPIYEGVLLQSTQEGSALNIFCTHGHQGDKSSDGNWFSKFFVANIWAPLQMLLKINPNTPAYDNQLKTLHNSIMYEWSASQENLLLITGHTHQPVFESLTHIERLYRQLLYAQQQNNVAAIPGIEKEIQERKFEYNHVSENYLNMKPCYFNSGCCCFNDGDITGIEIADGSIRLIKWHSKNGIPEREVLEEIALKELKM